MLPSQQWARNFTVESDDIDYLVNLLLEKETPMTSQQFARILVEKRLEDEVTALEERYKNTKVYNPAESYAIGSKLVFPKLDFATAVVTDVRSGDNAQYGEFDVMTVLFDDEKLKREFAFNFKQSHQLSEAVETIASFSESLTVDEIMNEAGDDILKRVEDHLRSHDTLISVARTWFPKDLMLDADEGSLNLTEAVLDMAEGGPLTAESILEQIGGLGESHISLQIFSLNYAMSKDDRFDEVGPTGEVLWYLRRMEPQDVQKTPQLLQYTAIEYDPTLVSPQMKVVEAELADELSPLEDVEKVNEATITLLYPHRRAGTLPINNKVHNLFPSARRSRRIWFTLVDVNDGEEFDGWVVPEGKYVYGLDEIYNKYQVPVGAYITLKRGENPDQILVDCRTHRAHSEWVNVLDFKDHQIHFETTRRNISTEFDDLLIVGIDNLEAVDTGVQHQQRKTLVSLLKMIIPPLSRLSPQGTVHIKTIYSVMNILRRCPPGPIMATLHANPDFENVGGEYWKLAE